MTKTKRGSLSHYVERVIKEKRLSRRDVRVRSGDEITESYVSGIVSGAFKNVSIEKLKALARGLRVPERQLIRVAFGPSAESESHRSDKSHNLILLNLTRKNFIGSDVAEIVQEVLKLTPPHRVVVLQYVKKLSKAEQRLKRTRANANLRSGASSKRRSM